MQAMTPRVIAPTACLRTFGFQPNECLALIEELNGFPNRRRPEWLSRIKSQCGQPFCVTFL
jgi:hypothetical protein